MMKPKWKWTAKYEDGTVIKQPPEIEPFLGDLDCRKVVFFSLKKGLKQFSLDLRTVEFKKNNNLLYKVNLNGNRPELFCVRRVTVDSLGHTINRKIVFGLLAGEKIIIEESGNWNWE